MFEDDVSLQGSSLVFNGSNAVMLLRKSRHPYHLSCTVNNNCTAAFGKDCYYNGVLNVIVSEERSVIIGDDCLFSFYIWLRTADPHLVYDLGSKRRINPSKDILIGDHVWIGQGALVLKGSYVGSGSIIGASSVVAGKTIGSNSSWGGNPVKLIRENVFWDGACVHTWTNERTDASMSYAGNPFIAKPSVHTFSLGEVGEYLHSLPSAREKLTFLQDEVYARPLTERFYLQVKKRRLFAR